uniref:Sodefrin-like factor A n=1 Tax=Boana cinerascens TaxID=2364978 RepID=A0A513ZV71_9NEOB|nr:sodefrin precursor-like factor A [Boana cinerascens]
MKILIAFQLFTIIAAGPVLKCMQCKTSDKEDCTGESVKCPNPGYVCAKGIEYDRLGEDLTRTVYRGCLNRTDICGSTFQFSTLDSRYSSYHECCKKDNCNHGPIKMPTRNTTGTGFQCNSCVNVGNTVCQEWKPKARIECRDKEAECFVFRGKVARAGRQIKEFYASGCAIKGFCTNVVDAFIGTKIIESQYLSCTKTLNVRNWQY